MTDMDLWHRMARQLTSDRMQEVVFAGLNGEVVEGMGEAEQFFYDRAVIEAAENPGVVWTPVEF